MFEILFKDGSIVKGSGSIHIGTSCLTFYDLDGTLLFDQISNVVSISPIKN